jgi:hypothetical protein
MINEKVSELLLFNAKWTISSGAGIILTLPGHPISPPVFSGVVLLDLLFSV